MTTPVGTTNGVAGPALSVRLGACALVLCAGQACTPGPTFVPPPSPAPEAWPDAPSEEVTVQTPTDLNRWWTTFDDPLLDDLIQRAQSSNYSLQSAVARIRASRAQLAVTKGLMYPTVNVGTEAFWRRLGDNGVVGDALSAAGYTGGFDPTGLFALGIDAAWEVDLFGRVRNSINAANAAYRGTVEEYRAVMVSLLAEVALAYVDVRTVQQRLSFARANAVAQQGTVQLTTALFETGVGAELDVVQSQSNLANTESTIPALEIELVAARNRLAVLLDADPAQLSGELGQVNPIPAPPPQVAAGLPADLLRQRPDIRAAEQALLAQNAQIGAAESRLYPQLQLGGALALESSQLDDLFKSSSTTWNIGGVFRWNVFDGSRRRNNVLVEEAVADQLVADYQNTVLVALQEAEDAMYSFEQEQARRDRLNDAVGFTQRSVDLVRVQYQTGVTDFNNVLDSERTLFVQQDQLATSTGHVMKHLIQLYKALGGGWDPTVTDPSVGDGEGNGR